MATTQNLEDSLVDLKVEANFPLKRLLGKEANLKKKNFVVKANLVVISSIGYMKLAWLIPRESYSVVRS